MRTFLSIALFGAISLLHSLAGEPRFPAFEVSPRDEPSLRFAYSAADASSSSPVIISMPGRALGKEDRSHRVDLQKHWLSVNVPKGYTFKQRTLNLCDYKREGEINFSDLYVFEDETGRQHEYYFYVGNWPIE